MWWQLKKISEDVQEIVYGYGCQSHNISGLLRVDKNTEKVEYKKLADGDTPSRFLWFAPHVWHTCFKEGAPDERMIAIG